MGSFLSHYFGVEWLLTPTNEDQDDMQNQDKFCYSCFDPTQVDKPLDRTKDIISIKHRSSPQKLDRTVHQGADTIWKCFKKTVWCFPDNKFLGVREQISQGFNAGNQGVKFGEYTWKTFREVDDFVESLSRSIIKRQLCPLQNSSVEGTPDLKFMGIFSENRLEWIMTEIACCSDSICIVPLAVENQFMNEDRISNVINKAQLCTLCVSKGTIGVILDLKSKDMVPHLKNLIIYDTPEDAHLTLATQVGFEIFSFTDLINEGYKIMDQQKDEPNADSILILGITSGTTGEPKLAMLSHLNFISAQSSVRYLGFNFTCDDVYLSYVPLTHVYEQILHIDAIMFGFCIGYSSGDIKNLVNDIQVLKPTIFGSFPAFFNKIHQKIKENIENKPNMIQTMIDHAVQSKIFSYMKYGKLTHSIYDAIVFKVMKNVLGGRIRFMVSGGAPLQVEVKSFLTVVFSAPIFEAYGITEAAGSVTCTAFWDRQGGHVGGPLPCIRMQLRDFPDFNIFTDSTPPIGIVYIKGNSVFKGYFKNPEQTAMVLDQDGWLKVGDVGILNKNGSVEIIDRMTEMKKLQNGQFIAPQKLENIYLHAPLINQIYIDINSNYNFLVAVVSLKEEKMLEYAEVNGLVGNINEFVRSQDVEYGVLKQLERAANTNKLDSIERIMRVHITKEPFSYKNGLMTNTQKMRRQEIKQRFRNEISNLYISCISQKIKEGQIGVQ